MSDRTLLEIFSTQLSSAISILAEEPSAAVRTRELDDVLGAAQLLGDPKLEERIAKLDPAEAAPILQTLRKILGQVRDDLRQNTSAAPDTNEAEPPDKLPASSPGDSSPTQVKKRPRKKSRRFDTGEHIALVNFFREEANECLERITELLLNSQATKPPEEMLHELMRLTHGLKGSAGTIELPEIASLTHEYENAVTKVHNDHWAWSLPLRDQFVAAADGIRSIVAEAESPDASAAHIEHWLAALRTLDQSPVPTFPPVRPALLISEASSDSYPERRRPDRRGMESPLLRVDPARIDRLMNSVGELVFDRTRIEKGVQRLESQMGGMRKALSALTTKREHWEQSEQEIGVDDLGAMLSELESTLRESLPQIDDALGALKQDTGLLRRTEFALQDGLTAVRMQSVRSLFQRLTPQLRSIAAQADKQVRLVTSGGETEFDKVVADQLIDPIIQLLRNAVAHGIETPQLRAAHNKSPEGRIHVTARHEANVVVLEVSDDGNGVDIFKLREKFRSTGKWTKEQAESATDARVLAQIFEAGYSGAAEVDQLAGRGVGLSLVRETVTRLGGEVTVSSVAGQGTTFTLRLPLTTAMVNAMLFKVGGHVFAIPNVHVLAQSTIPCPPDDKAINKAIDFKGASLPLLPLHDILGFDRPPDKAPCPVVFLEYLGKGLVISCDKIIGPREVVLQNLGPMLSGIPLYAGGTVSPSGKVQLILDPSALVKIAYPQDEDQITPRPEVGGVAQRVLVVDDSKAIREAMRRMLGRAGYDVITASDGLSAWHRLLEHHFDALVTDLEMPGESGFDLLKRLQDDARFHHIPKLVISSKADSANRERAQELGALRFLAKPVNQAQLVDALRDARKQQVNE